MVSPTYWKKNTQSKFEGAQGKQSTQTWHFLNWSQVTDAQKFVLDLRTQSRVFWHHNSQWWWEDKVNLTDLSWSTIWGQTVPQLSSALFPGKTESQCMEPFLTNQTPFWSGLLVPALLMKASSMRSHFHLPTPVTPGRREYRAFHLITAVSGAVQLLKHFASQHKPCQILTSSLRSHLWVTMRWLHEVFALSVLVWITSLKLFGILLTEMQVDTN